MRDFFGRYWDERLRDVQDRFRHVPADDADGFLEVLEEGLRQQGFTPEVYRNGAVTMRECNCPFPEAVKRTRFPCRLEATFYERLLDNPARRVTCIPDGFAACTYEFRALPDEA